MDKVYFNKDYYGCWWLKELTDIYSFKAVKFETNEEVETILTWTRNIDLSEYDNTVVRMYDVEIDGEKFYFLASLEKGGYLLEPKDRFSLEKLLNEKNIFFTGEKLENPDL
jgi:hypothetical protein